MYAPQESKTKISTYNEMYKHISSRIKMAKQDNERVVVTGDFNAKIGEAIKGNKKEVSKSGKILLKMVLEEELMIINKNKKCQGKWTRMIGKQKSILDYMLMFQEDEKYINSMIIDEEKEHTPQYTEKTKTTFSDHCAMIVEIGWTCANIERQAANKRLVMTDRSLMKFFEKTQHGNLENIMKEETDLTKRSIKWMEEVNRIMDGTFEIRKEFREKNT